MGRLFLYQLLLLCPPHFLPTSAAERLDFDLSDPEVCPMDATTRDINIYSQAAVFRLEAGGNLTLPRKCRLLVKSSGGEGIMVYTAAMYLRPGELTGCLDYVQFGEDDLIPFMTIRKSEKLCNDMTGWSYDVKGGSLLVWLSLGEARPSASRGSFRHVKLRIVITAYKKSPIFSSYRECGAPGHFIHESYFCDGQPNCATDGGPEGPLDESDRFCAAITTTPASSSALTPLGEDIAFDKKEDLRLGTIIAISLGVVVLLATTAVCCVRKCGKVQTQDAAHAQSQEFCSDIRLYNLSPLSSALCRPVSSIPVGDGGGLAYTHSDGRGGGGSGAAMAAIPEEAPPAYNDIFPEGYQYNKEEATHPP